MLLLLFTCITLNTNQINGQGLTAFQVSSRTSLYSNFGETIVGEAQGDLNIKVYQGFVQQFPLLRTRLKNYQSTSFQIFPSPTKDYINLKIKDVNGQEIFIKDPTGRIIFNSPVEDNTTIIDLISWPPGIYYISIVDQSKTYIIKPIIKI